VQTNKERAPDSSRAIETPDLSRQARIDQRKAVCRDVMLPGILLKLVNRLESLPLFHLTRHRRVRVAPGFADHHSTVLLSDIQRSGAATFVRIRQPHVGR